jgi:hypothetical protein
MSFIDRFSGGNRLPEEYSVIGNRIEERRLSLLQSIERFIPPVHDHIAIPEGSEAPAIELAWVTVQVPRNQYEEPKYIDVQPVLPLEWVEDAGHFATGPRFARLVLNGKLPNGEKAPIGSMTIPSELHYEPILRIESVHSHPDEYTSWLSYEAELWLSLAEAAINQQPRRVS